MRKYVEIARQKCKAAMSYEAIQCQWMAKSKAKCN